MITQAASPRMISRSIASRSLNGTFATSSSLGLRQEELREAVVADLHREARCGRDSSAARQMIRRRLVAWRALFSAMSIASPPPEREHRILQALGRVLRQHLGELGAHQRREMMVADVEVVHALLHRGDHFRIAVAERVDAAVEMQVDQPAAVHVVEVVALAAVDHEVDALALPLQRLAGVPDFERPGDEVVLGLAHRALARSPWLCIHRGQPFINSIDAPIRPNLTQRHGELTPLPLHTSRPESFHALHDGLPNRSKCFSLLLRCRAQQHPGATSD